MVNGVLTRGGLHTAAHAVLRAELPSGLAVGWFAFTLAVV